MCPWVSRRTIAIPFPIFHLPAPPNEFVAVALATAGCRIQSAECRVQSAECRMPEKPGAVQVANLIEIESTFVSFCPGCALLCCLDSLLIPHWFSTDPAPPDPLDCIQLICATNEFICHLYAGKRGRGE